MEVAQKALVYRCYGGWTWHHQGCDANGEDETIVPRLRAPRTWWGDIRPGMVDAFKRAQRHMKKEHGLGTRQADHH